MSSEFQFPKIYSFPPFYTKQPNSTVFNNQINAWCELVLDYCEHYKITSLTSNGKIGESQFDLLEENVPSLFENDAINRSVKDEFRRTIFKTLLKQGKIEFKNPKFLESNIIVYWRSLAEWSQILYNYVDKTGQLNTILTVYELTKLESSNIPEDLRNLEYDVLVRVLRLLVKQGKAQIIVEEGSDQIGGVKIV